MKPKQLMVAKDGTKLGDVVLLIGKTPMYGRVIDIKQRIATWSHYRKAWKKGDEIDSILTIEKLLNLDLTAPLRAGKVTAQYSEDYVVVNRAFIKKSFRKLNDLVAYIRMINEQEEP